METLNDFSADIHQSRFSLMSILFGQKYIMNGIIDTIKGSNSVIKNAIWPISIVLKLQKLIRKSFMVRITECVGVCCSLEFSEQSQCIQLSHLQKIDKCQRHTNRTKSKAIDIFVTFQIISNICRQQWHEPNDCYNQEQNFQFSHSHFLIRAVFKTNEYQTLSSITGYWAPYLASKYCDFEQTIRIYLGE